MSFIEECNTSSFRRALSSLEERDFRIRTLRYIMGEHLFLEWANSVGVSHYSELRDTCSSIAPIGLRSIVAAEEESLFLWTGIRDLTEFMDRFRRHWAGKGGAKPRVLDFGCGCGRLLRYLDHASSVQAYGVDTNEDHVRWCSENLTNVTVQRNPVAPPLPFEEGVFDLVYSLSVFTHLDEEDACRWIDELQRVLVPGGMLIFTTHGYPALDTICGSQLHRDMFRLSLEQAQNIHRHFHEVPFAFVPYGVDRLEAAMAGSSYGDTFVHANYVHERWATSGLRVVEHVSGGLRGWQDLYILQKECAI